MSNDEVIGPRLHTHLWTCLSAALIHAVVAQAISQHSNGYPDKTSLLGLVFASCRARKQILNFLGTSGRYETRSGSRVLFDGYIEIRSMAIVSASEFQHRQQAFLLHSSRAICIFGTIPGGTGYAGVAHSDCRVGSRKWLHHLAPSTTGSRCCRF